MNISILKPIVIDFLKKVKHAFSEGLRLPYARLYLALSLALTIVFLVLTFPYEVIIRNQLQKLESVIRGSIYVGEMDFSLIGDSYIDNLQISTANNVDFNMKNVSLNISVNPYTTLLNKTLKGSILIKNFNYSSGNISISSLLNSQFELKMDQETSMPSNGFFNIDLKDISAKGINIKGFDIPPVKFTSIKGNTVITNRQVMINNLSFTGNDLRGLIKGSIQLEKFFNSSRLNLRIEIDTASKILQDYKMLLSNLIDPGSERLVINITGTLYSPNVNLPFKAAAAGSDKRVPSARDDGPDDEKNGGGKERRPDLDGKMDE